MLVTENEAKEKRCITVYAATFRLQSVTDRNAALLAGNHNCIGSACMAWRWECKTADGSLEIGYCGLAGALNPNGPVT